ncbi:hypothetical protein GCM10010431_55280 [Streptomyces kunmingensis]
MPAAVLPLVLLVLVAYQTVADKDPVNGRAGRKRLHVALAELVHQGPGSPPRVLLPQFADQGF